MRTVIHLGLGALLSLACSSSSSSTGSGGVPQTDSGTTADGASGTDGSSGVDAGPPPSATIAVGSCPAFAPCGGAIPGTWAYSGGCVDDPLTSIKGQCPAATVSNELASAQGTLVITGTTITRQVATTLSATLLVPQSCSSLIGGCTALSALVKASGLTGTCTGTTDCTCTLTRNDVVSDTSAYTMAGNTVTTGAGETYDVCVAGAKLSYSQTAGKGKVAGTFELTKR